MFGDEPVKKHWHVLVEKYIDGVLTSDEQDFIVSEIEVNPDFAEYWQEALGNVSIVDSQKGSEELESFLSTALFLDRKVQKAKSKSTIPFIVKLAALLALAGGAFLIYKRMQSIDAVVISSTYENILQGSEISKESYSLSNGILRFDYEVADCIIEGPAEFSLTNSNQLNLNSGKIFIDASKSEGLKINAGNAVYEDIGTRFAIEKNNDKSEVHVFDGLVKTGADKVEAGMALRADGQSKSQIPIKKGYFINGALLKRAAENVEYYRNSQKLILDSSDLIKVYDFMDIKDVSELKALGLEFQNIELLNGPFLGSSSIKFKAKDSYVKIPFPKHKSFSLVFEFYYDDFKNEPNVIMNSDTNAISASQKMDWFKREYWNNELGVIGSRFYTWRSFSIHVGLNDYSISNNMDTNYTRPLNGDRGKTFIFGNSGRNNFQGRLARVVILKSQTKAQIRSYFRKF